MTGARSVSTAVLAALVGLLPACGRDGFGLRVEEVCPTCRGDAGAGDAASGPPTITIDSPGQQQTVASFQVFVGGCTAGLEIAVAYGAGAGGPATVACVGGRFAIPVGFAGSAGPRSVAVSQTDGDGKVGSVERTVQLSLAGFNAPRGFDRGPRLLADPSNAGGVYVLGACFYGNTEIGGLARLAPDGSLDPTFRLLSACGTMGDFFSTVYAVAVDPASGKLYVGGAFTALGGASVGHIARLNHDGTVDPTFATGSGFGGTSSGVAALLWDPEASTVTAVGSFTTFSGAPAPGIARLLADGSLDPSFSPGSGFTDYPSVIAMDAAKRLVIAGSFATYDGVARGNIVRVNPDGSLDQTFDPGTGPNGTVQTVVMSPGGGVYIGGGFSSFNGQPASGVARLTEAGALDPGFDNPSGGLSYAAFVVDSAGRLYAARSEGSGPFYVDIARLTSTGVADPTFSTGTGFGFGASFVNGGLTGLLLDEAGGTLTVGAIPGLWAFRDQIVDEVFRIRLDGTLEETYNPSAGFDGAVDGLAWDEPTSKLVAVGHFKLHSGGTHHLGGLARVSADGELDLAFNLGGSGFDGDPTRVIADPVGGGWYVLGRFLNFNGFSASRVVRLTADGSRDPSFLFDPLIVTSSLEDIATDSAGRLLVAGSAWQTGARGVVRVTSSGARDPTFAIGAGAEGGFLNEVRAIVWDPVGRHLYVGGDFSSFGGLPRPYLARLAEDGAVDTTFDPGSAVSSEVDHLVWEPSTSTLYVGAGFSGHLQRFRADGTEDTAFRSRAGFISQIWALCLDAGLGRLYASGIFDHPVALALDGTREPGFTAGFGTNSVVTACVVDPATHDVYLAGRFTVFHHAAVKGIVRLRSDGSLAP